MVETLIYMTLGCFLRLSHSMSCPSDLVVNGGDDTLVKVTVRVHAGGAGAAVARGFFLFLTFF